MTFTGSNDDRLFLAVPGGFPTGKLLTYRLLTYKDKYPTLSGMLIEDDFTYIFMINIVSNMFTQAYTAYRV